MQWEWSDTLPWTLLLKAKAVSFQCDPGCNRFLVAMLCKTADCARDSSSRTI